MTALIGIWTPTLVPLDDRGRIHESELRRFIDWLIASGVHGLFPNGSTGEFTRFTSEERQSIAKITCEQARGRVPVIVGSAESSIEETLRASEAYLSMGARAVAVVAPYYFPLKPVSVLEYFRQVGNASPIDVLLYNMPLFANPIDLDSVEQLSRLPRIIGIKDSSGDLPFIMRMIQRIRPQRPDFSFLTGWDPMIVPMLMAGATGGVNATSDVAPELVRKMYDLTVSVLHLFDRLFLGWNFPDGFRIGADARGFDFGHGRQPSGLTMPKSDLDSIKAEMAELSCIVEKSEHS
jgi:4-hydroxy-tetrahydrodipicolinate synthase